MVPVTLFGKIFGAVCAISGIIIVALPVGLLASNFSDTYKLINFKKNIKKKFKHKQQYKPIRI
jgi:hypothetical protein